MCGRAHAVNEECGEVVLLLLSPLLLLLLIVLVMVLSLSLSLSLLFLLLSRIGGTVLAATR